MEKRSFSEAARFSSLLVILVTIASPSQARVNGRVHKFQGGTDGANTQAGLIADAFGNFYGTTYNGGRDLLGNVFRWSRDQNGQWNGSTIYSFTGGPDGESPAGNLAIDAAGNLYGTASQGGSGGWGTVFELTQNPNGSWTETTLYSFKNASDGGDPSSGVIFDAIGNLYGTTLEACNSSCIGTVFKLAPSQSGPWQETTLYIFPDTSDGASPSGVVFDNSGNLYGATTYGGTVDYGTVFKLSPSQGGSWTKTILHSFEDGLDGGSPSSGLTPDGLGNFYGETFYGGSLACPQSGCGVVYKLSPQPGGNWDFSVAHTFNGLNYSKGYNPAGGLAVDNGGNLYGATIGGGRITCAGFGFPCGMIYELTPTAEGATFRILASFDGTHGGSPWAGVIIDAAGNLYGTTEQGGDFSTCPPHGCGVVFELTP